MNVLHVYKTYRPEDFTGAPRVIHTLAEETRALGVTASVLTLGPEAGELLVDGHRVHVAHRDLEIASTGFSLGAPGLFRRLLQTTDIVHYHYPWPFADILHFLARPRCATLVTYHSDVVKQKALLPLYAPLRDRFLDSLDAVVATSPNYAETSAVLQRLKRKTHTIPIGIAEAPAVRPELVAQWRERLGDGFFLFVGALRHYKGLDYLIEAARISGLPVVIAGRGDNSLTRDVANVQAIGAVSEDDKIALLELCCAFVLPSHLRSEAFGIALLEAARAGRPMISCEIGTGTSHVNAGGVTGLVVEPASGAAIAEAMQTLAGDRDLAQRMGAAARKRYEMLFRAETMAAGYAALYRELLTGRAE